VLSKHTNICAVNYLITVLVALATLLLAGCAHQTKIKPSTGHIDGATPKQNANQNVDAAPIPKLAKPSPVLPPPKATSKAQTYSVVVNEVPVKEILFALARESKLNIDIHPSIQGRATLNAVDQTLPAILERLARQVDLTYKMENNVLYITPDQPVLRAYKVDYVNMNRDTEGFIGADGQISSSAQSSGSGSSTTTTSGNGANNSSRTLVTSKSKNHLWESLIQNIKELLAETDKEVIVTRFGSVGEKSAVEKTGAENNKTQTDTNKADNEQREEQRSEYKTLFAANVIANPETGVISVRATNKQHEKVQEFMDRVLHDAKKQVLVEATIVEVVLKDSFQAGIDWSRLNNSSSNSGFVFGQSLGKSNLSVTGNTLSTPGSTSALNDSVTSGFVFGYLNPLSRIGNIAASINLLKQFGDTKVLSSPKLMVLNNQTAVLKVVDNLVYFTVQAQQSTVGGTVGGTLATFTTTPNTVPVGIVMSVTPQINDTGTVGINVRPSITRVIDSVQDPNPNLRTGINNSGPPIKSEIPVIRVREMESMLQINSGNTAVLGGLMQDEIIRNTDKVPGLSEIPGVGNVFKGKNDATRKTELVIFLRPTVIGNASLESDELQSYKQYLPAQQLEKALEDAN
jgi:MSHA biogenesis protein MshL